MTTNELLIVLRNGSPCLNWPRKVWEYRNVLTVHGRFIYFILTVHGILFIIFVLTIHGIRINVKLTETDLSELQLIIIYLNKNVPWNWRFVWNMFLKVVLLTYKHLFFKIMLDFDIYKYIRKSNLKVASF